MGIAGDKPRQLAPTVGTMGSGSTDSPAPSPTTSKIGIDTLIGIAAPTDAAKIGLDTIVGIAAPTDVAKIGLDNIVGIAAPTDVAKIGIDTAVGIAVPTIANANPMEPEIDAVDSTIISLLPAANVIDPIPSTTGVAPKGYDMAFGLFNFHVDSNGAMELLSIGESAPLVAKTTTSPAVGGELSASPLLAPSEEEPNLKTSTPSVGSNDFEDPPPSPTTAYCVDCDAYHYVGAGDFSSHEIAGCEDPRGGHSSCLPDDIRMRSGSQRPHTPHRTVRPRLRQRVVLGLHMLGRRRRLPRS
jgi:hypothetical protein